MAKGQAQRRLAAIVAIDVAGYSRLMGADEEGTLATLKGHRDAMTPMVQGHGGRLVGQAGDGLLLEFPSVVEAVQCAIEIQAAMAQRNDGIADDNKMQFRIGINLGDVLVDGDDIFGDGVNVAARLEALAEPGGICLSRTVRDNVRDRMEIALEDRGEVEVKNIARPVRVFRVLGEGEEVEPARRDVPRLKYAAAMAVIVAIIAGGGAWWWQPWVERVEPARPDKLAFELPDKPSVAVLPFDVTSSNKGDLAFSHAVNEDLTRSLARVSGLFVIARGSTLDYVGANVVPARVAEELGVRYIVRATLRRVQNRVRIDAELADAISGRIVWSDRFDRDSSDLFVLQDDLVQALVSRIAQDLSNTGDHRRYTQDVDAYFSWFEGDRESWLNTPAAYGKARALALKALERDPDFVRAKALMAFVETQTGYFKLVDDIDATLSRAHAKAKTAVAAHPDDWYTQSVYAQTLLNRRDYKAAAVAYNRAIELEPANAALLTRSTLPLIFLGRGKEAEARLRVAIRLNPFHDWLPDQLLGQALYLQGRYREGANRLNVARRKNPRFIGNMWWRAATFGQLEKTQEARAAVGEILARTPNAAISQSFIQITNDAAMERFRDGLRAAGLPENPPPAKPPVKPAIAVLPFANLSNDKEQEYFADGMTDDLITDLSKVSGLIVIARNSVFTYKGRNVKVQDVARDLNVTHVLEGSVRRAGGKVRINAQLIDAHTGDHLWAERYDRELTDVFAVQDDVTREITAVLAVKLSGREEARLHRTQQIDPDAYDLLLRGLERLRRQTKATNAEAREYFERALAIDPDFARAHADIAYSHALDLFGGYSTDPAETTRLGEAAMEKAFRLDRELPQAHFARAALSRVQRRHREALTAIKKLIEIAPNNADGHASLSLSYTYLGRPQEGLRAVRTAIRLNPHSSIFYHWALGLAYFHLERFGEAAAAFETVAERNPQFLRGHLLLAATYGQLGRIEDAEWEAEEALSILPGITLSQQRLIVPYARQADTDRYIEGLREAGLPEG